MRRAWIVLAVLATTLAGSAPLAQAQESSTPQAQAQESSAPQVQAQEGSAPQAQAQGSSAPQAQAHKRPTLGGHIGFLLPLVTQSGGQTTSLADQPAVGFPIGITVKGSGRTAFDLEFVPQYNSTGQRLTTLTIHPGLIYSLGHGYAVGLRAAFVVDNPTVGLLRRGRPASPFQPAGRRACDQRRHIRYALRSVFLSAPGCAFPNGVHPICKEFSYSLARSFSKGTEQEVKKGPPQTCRRPSLRSQSLPDLLLLAVRSPFRTTNP
jgi:hypothetical protein